MKITLSLSLLLLMATTMLAQRGAATRVGGGNQSIYGDITVAEGTANSAKPITLDVILYNEYGNTVSRQRVSSNTRYRFMNLNSGKYYIVVELDDTEVTRFNVDLSSPLLTDIRQDIQLALRNNSSASTTGVVSAADRYDRPAKNAAIFTRAVEASKNKHYDQAVSLFTEVVEADKGDFPAWFELGTTYFIQKNYDEAEKSYAQAIAAHPGYVAALIGLGRLRITQKNFEGAIDALSQAVKAEPTSAQANYFLGEAYLQIKKGSLAVGYLNEAIRLDPVGMADAHLRLATLYNAVGMKDKAAAEYEQYLKQVPDSPDKKKLQEYINANKKP